VRVYYEDTDTGGIVYYANFLKFFERCRTEWLRALGFEQQTMKDALGLQFVVVSIAVDYLRPARLDDALTADAQVSEMARTYLSFSQQLWRDAELLARATVKVACVNAQTLVPARLPPELGRRLKQG